MTVLRTAKDYRIRELMNHNLETHYLRVGRIQKDRDTFLVNEVVHETAGNIQRSLIGVAFTPEHFAKLELNPVARKFFDYSNTLSSVLTAVEECMNYATSDRLHINVIIHQPLTDEMLEVIRSYANKYLPLAKYGQTWCAEHITVDITLSDYEKSELATPQCAIRTFTIGTNGGKDSSLCNMMMTKIGYEPYRIELTKDHMGYYSDDESPTGLVRFCENSQFFNTLEEKSREYMVKTRERVLVAPQSMMVLFYYLPYLVHFLETGLEPRFVCMGSEIGCSNEWQIEGETVPDLAFEEGVYAKRLFSSITKAVGYRTHTEVISPISGMYEVAIVNLLQLMGDPWTMAGSCWSREYWFRDNTPACEFCYKCLRNKLIIRHLVANCGYKADTMLDPSLESVLPISPSMYCYSISSTDTYAFLRGAPSDIDYARTMFVSPDIKDFVGVQIFDEVCKLVRSYGFEIIDEPEPNFDLNLVPESDVIDYAIKHFYGHNHWEEQPTDLGDTTKYACMMGLPFEGEILMQRYPLPLYSYFNIWKFYDDAGKEVRVKVHHTDHPFTRDGDREVPTFDHPVVRNALRWQRDKENLLNYFKTEGSITGYEIL